MSSMFKLTELDNGMRVASESMPNLETTCLGVWVDVGARYEEANVNGVAHLLEHMAFKGTRRRSARGLAEEIEDVGGSVNAYTSREHTAFYARILGSDVPLAADLISDILQNSTLDEGELEKEREVILQEIGQARDTPDDWVFDVFQEAAYPDQPLGRSILGPEEIVGGMTRDTVLGYMRAHYSPSRMILAAGGKVDHEALVDLGAKLFTDLPAKSATAVRPPRATYVGGIKLEPRKDLEQAHVVVGVEAFGHDDPDYFALQVFSAALGGGMSSRLFQEVRENRGLCYSVFSFAAAYEDTGIFGVYAGTDPGAVPELFQVVEAEAAKFIADPRAGEIARARAQLKASLLMALEGAYNVTDDTARQLLSFGRRKDAAELIALVDAVDEAAIRRVGQRLFSGSSTTVAAVGPLKDLPPINLHRLAS
ncbi:Predicted Zn-dependent peptidase [Arboricoccus pini]|uniref:Predicted Zn-dependent peptidase n=1 Tax=Arboricoccus pini TaxID=1963835 RepID=A0A212QZF4_9PROT|nr:pitrilysin family protein [Arboricoccus pini]SNB65076.1 Predicted Zn-dependent peptidase [Arboricoccus pini]